jgi:hypothetical protein
MLKCVLRFTAILKPCNPQTIPPMTCRHYDLRRRGGLEQADDSIDGSDTKETEEEKPTFKGIFDIHSQLHSYVTNNKISR